MSSRMVTTPLILAIAFGYVGLLFAIAYFADRRAGLCQFRMADLAPAPTPHTP